MTSSCFHCIHLHVCSGARETKDIWAAMDKIMPSDKQKQRTLISAQLHLMAERQ